MNAIEESQRQGQPLGVQLEVGSQAARGSGGHDAVRAKAKRLGAGVNRYDGAQIHQLVKFRFRKARQPGEFRQLQLLLLIEPQHFSEFDFHF